MNKKDILFITNLCLMDTINAFNKYIIENICVKDKKLYPILLSIKKRGEIESIKNMTQKKLK